MQAVLAARRWPCRAGPSPDAGPGRPKVPWPRRTAPAPRPGRRLLLQTQAPRRSCLPSSSAVCASSFSPLCQTARRYLRGRSPGDNSWGRASRNRRGPLPPPVVKRTLWQAGRFPIDSAERQKSTGHGCIATRHGCGTPRSPSPVLGVRHRRVERPGHSVSPFGPPRPARARRGPAHRGDPWASPLIRLRFFGCGEQIDISVKSRIMAGSARRSGAPAFGL